MNNVPFRLKNTIEGVKEMPQRIIEGDREPLGVDDLDSFDEVHRVQAMRYAATIAAERSLPVSQKTRTLPGAGDLPVIEAI